MTLRDRAEQAARELSVNITNFVGGDWHDDDINGIAGDIADAIQRVARETVGAVKYRLFDAGYSAALADHMNGNDAERQRREEIIAEVVKEATE